MSNIIDLESIIKDEIDNNNYVETLFFTLLRHNIISDSDYEQVILKLLNLLSTQIKRYTGELTSSVPVEVAKNINISNMWTISLYLKGKDIKESTQLLLCEDINSLYKLGKTELNNLIFKTKMFYNVVFLNNIIDTNNYFYNATLKEGIKGFFKMYNPDYDSTNIFITVDYDAYLERPKLNGIEFIKQYLDYIYYENMFCKQFDSAKINNLLKAIYSNYEELPINIFEHILTTTIILEYLGMDIFDLNLLDINIYNLYRDYKQNNEEYRGNLKVAYNSLINKLKLDSSTINYLDKCSGMTVNKIVSYTENNNLEILLGRTEKKEINYIPSEKMSNSEYRKLIDLLNKTNKEDKVNIIIENITSLYDFIDVMEDISFSSEELFKVFSKFQIIELMALKKYYYDDIKDSYIERELNGFIMTKSIAEQNIINNNYQYITIT